MADNAVTNATNETRFITHPRYFNRYPSAAGKSRQPKFDDALRISPKQRDDGVAQFVHSARVPKPAGSRSIRMPQRLLAVDDVSLYPIHDRTKANRVEFRVSKIRSESIVVIDIDGVISWRAGRQSIIDAK